MRAAEHAAMARGASAIRLMEIAGRAVADVAAEGLKAGARVAVLAGPGNNGGDGYVAARLLAARGHDVRVFGLPIASRGAADAMRMARLWTGAIEPPDETALSAFAPHLIVDALFGTGLSRAPAGEAAALIRTSNMLRASGARVVAADIPSGWPGDGGEAPGDAIDADATVTFHCAKPAHALFPSRTACGVIRVCDIGLPPPGDESEDWAVNGCPADLRRPADVTGHKYDHGHLLVLAGGIEGVGAARLSARGGLRGGAGLVTIGTPAQALPAHAARGPDALMLRHCDGEDGLAALLDDARRNAVVIGPAYGVGPATRQAVAQVLGAGRRAVIDADAITSFSGAAEYLADLIRPAAGDTVLTPHEGEFARLFSPLSASVAGEIQVSGFVSKLQRALAAARFTGAIVVLKGADTVIAAPDGRARVNLDAPPWLATAGSGDVLAGLIGARLAQGLEAFEAAAGAVWLHGAAARRAGRGLIADDLPEAVAAVLRDS